MPTKYPRVEASVLDVRRSDVSMMDGRRCVAVSSCAVDNKCMDVSMLS